MAEYFAGGHLRFVNSEWRDDSGNAIEISRVQHGRWIGRDIDHMWFRCSLCSKETHSATTYCPNCGGKLM